jgi:hypothetical protein
MCTGTKIVIKPGGIPDVDGRIILKWILKTHDLRVFTGFMWLRIGKSSGGAVVNTVMNL